MDDINTSVVGTRITRVDAKAKTRGEAQYAADIRIPGMLHALVLRSKYPHALIQGFDGRAASQLPGVQAILTARDVPGRNAHGLIIKDHPVLASERVRYLGDALAVVAASTEVAAMQALSLIKVSYEELPAMFDPEKAMEPDSIPIHAGGNILLHKKLRKGNPEQAFNRADVVVEQTYKTQLVAHSPLETEAGMAFPTPDGGVEVWVSTQNPHYDRTEIAACLGIPEAKVRVKQTVTGGGFGAKLDISVQCHLALVAWYTRKPVRMVYTVADHFQVSAKRHPLTMVYKMGATTDGRIVGAHIKLVADTGAYASYGPSVVNRVLTHCTGAYSIPNIAVDSYGIYTNNTPAGAMRGFGVPQVTFACETHIDTLARRIGIHPAEIRMTNALAPGRQTSTGQILRDSVGLQKAIDVVCSASDFYPRARG